MEENLTSKSAVALLHEVLAPLRLSPKFDIVDISEECQFYKYLYFKCCVTVGNMKALGGGRSKKLAKQVAARSMLKILHGVCAMMESSTSSAGFTKISSDELNPSRKNPVGDLQELCAANNFQLPIYNVISEEGPPHDHIFMVEACALAQTEIGVAKGKRRAKRIAAQKLLERLKQKDSVSGAPVEDSKECISSQKSEVKDYMTLLQEISLQANFRVEYMDLDQKDGLYEYLVRLTMLPQIVCRGEGMTPYGAVTNAAKNAFECLKLIKQHPYLEVSDV